MAIPQTPSPLSAVLAAKTYNAAWFNGATKEAQIQSAINNAVSDGALYVFVPANMLPYNVNLVTFNPAVKMLREGGDPAVYDVQAYGANPASAVLDSAPAIQAAINQAAAAANGPGTGGGVVYVSRGTYGVFSTITVPRGIILRGDGGLATGATAQGSQLIQQTVTGPIISLNDQGGTGAIVEDLFLFGGNNLAHNTGGLLIVGMSGCTISRVNVNTTNTYGFRVQGGTTNGDALENRLFRCIANMTGSPSSAAAYDLLGSTNSSPNANTFMMCRGTGSNYVGFNSVNGGVLTDTTVMNLCEFDWVFAGAVTAIQSNGITLRASDNRFENTGAGGSITVNLTGNTSFSPNGFFKSNVWAAPAAVPLSWNDSGLNPAHRVDEQISAALNVSSLLTFGTRVFTLTDAATIAVDASRGGVFVVTLGGSRVLGTATNAYAGQRVLFVVIQDATGGRTLSLANYPRLQWSDAGNISNKVSTIAAVFDGTNWNPDGKQTPYLLGLVTQTTTMSSTQTATLDQTLILCDATTAAFTVTLPTPPGGSDSKVYRIKKIDASANAVTIATSGGTIDGVATKVLAAQFASVDLQNAGANWFIV